MGDAALVLCLFEVVLQAVALGEDAEAVWALLVFVSFWSLLLLVSVRVVAAAHSLVLALLLVFWVNMQLGLFCLFLLVP